jgi:hypothetical protein
MSYTSGSNIVIDTIYNDLILTHHENAGYKGVLAFVSYNYLFFHGHLSVGYAISWRDYFKMYSPQVQNGINIEFNF